MRCRTCEMRSGGQRVRAKTRCVDASMVMPFRWNSASSSVAAVAADAPMSGCEQRADEQSRRPLVELVDSAGSFGPSRGVLGLPTRRRQLGDAADGVDGERTQPESGEQRPAGGDAEEVVAVVPADRIDVSLERPCRDAGAIVASCRFDTCLELGNVGVDVIVEHEHVSVGPQEIEVVAAVRDRVRGSAGASTGGHESCCRPCRRRRAPAT